MKREPQPNKAVRQHGFLRVSVASVAAGMLVATLLAVNPAGAAMRAGARSAARYGFDSPDAAAAYGNDLFVANRGGNSVTELNAGNGALVRVISSKEYGFRQPTAVAVVGADVFVANEDAGLTELKASNGAFVRTLRGHYGFAGPIALSVQGTSVYVLSAKGAVSRLSAVSGLPEGVADGSGLRFNAPTAIAVVGDDLFVANSGGNSVTEINAGSMKLVRVLSGGAFQFNTPTGVAAHDGDVWVTNYNGSSVTEFEASTDGSVHVYSIYAWSGPMTYGDGYFFAVSPPGSSPMVSEVLPHTGASLWMECNTNQPTPNFSNPQAAAVVDGHVWVVNEGSAFYAGGSLTELDLATGNSIRQVGQPLK